MIHDVINACSLTTQRGFYEVLVSQTTVYIDIA